MIVTIILLAACGVVTSELPVIHTATMVPSTKPSTPSPFLIATPTPDFCNIMQDQDEIEVMSGLLFTALEPGGPQMFDRILVQQNPLWSDFRQEDQGEMRSAGIIFHETSFGPEWGTGVNPAVILVTYGVDRNWELPINGDLVSDVENIRAILRQHETDWIIGKVDYSQYPMLVNGATYTLYRYFNADLSKLETWCRTYVQVYGESPLQ